MGYYRAGFDVVGVDIAPQPNYPFEFIQAGALTYLSSVGDLYDAFHASPPCQAYSQLAPLHPDKEYAELIIPIRTLLLGIGAPYVIENVANARKHLRNPVQLCGSSFGLPIRRHRLFETNWKLDVPPCLHDTQGELVGIYGSSDGFHPPGFKHPGWKRGPRQATTDEARQIMGMPWATRRRELTEAIPPVFTELIGRQLLCHL